MAGITRPTTYSQMVRVLNDVALPECASCPCLPPQLVYTELRADSCWLHKPAPWSASSINAGHLERVHYFSLEKDLV